MTGIQLVDDVWVGVSVVVCVWGEGVVHTVTASDVVHFPTFYAPFPAP